MVCAIAFVFLAAMKGIGGYDSTVSLIESIDPQLLNPWTALAGGAILLISNLAWGLASYAWPGFGAAFRPVILFSLFWKNTTRNGALGGMVIGGLTAIIWKQLSGGIFDLYEIVPGFLLSCMTIYTLNILDKEGPAEEILREFDYINNVILHGKSTHKEDIGPLKTRHE